MGITRDKPGDLSNLIARLIAFATALISFVVTVVNLIALARGQQTVVSLVTLSTAVSVLWISCLYFALARIETQRTTFKKGRQTVRTYRYSPLIRRIAWVGLAAVSILVPTGYLVLRHRNEPFENKFTIVVADFESVDGQNYGVTQQLIEKLRSSVQDYSEVTVQPLNRVITAKEGRKFADELARNAHASIILWGWCQRSQLTVHFDLLERPDTLPLIQDKETLVTSGGTGLDQSFVVQTQASSDMTYLTLLTIGLLRFEMGDNDGAIERWRKALTLRAEPYQMVEPTRLYRYIGQAYVSKGDFSAAISNFTTAIELDPQSAEAFMGRGAAYYLSANQAGASADSDRAIELLTEYLKESPDDEQAYYFRGICYYHKKDNTRAIADYSLAIKLRPDFAFALDNRAGSYFDQQDYQNALADLDEVIRLAPSTARYFSRGSVLLKMERFALAIADYTRAIELNQEYTYAYVNRAYAYDHIGKSDEALRDYNRVIEMRPQMSDGYDGRGLFYASRGSLPSALSDFNAAISLSPSDPVLYRHRGMAYVQAGSVDEGMKDLDRALTMRPNDAQALNYRGIGYGQRGDFKHAIDDFTKALAVEPANRSFLLNRSRAYQEIGDVAKAEADRTESEKLKSAR